MYLGEATMFNLIKQKQSLVLTMITCSIVSSNGFAAVCTTANATGCCGNGIIETVGGVLEQCDMGSTSAGVNLNNGSSTNSLSGCTSACTKSTPTADWNCSTDVTSYTTQTAELSRLFKKLSYWYNGKKSDGTTAIVADAATGVISNPRDCNFYNTGGNVASRTPIYRAAWVGDFGAGDGASTYNCKQYQRDFLKFMTLNYNTPVKAADCTLLKPFVNVTPTTPGSIALPNPLPIEDANATRYSSPDLYIVNGCI